jgi:hypothetical protein
MAQAAIFAAVRAVEWGGWGKVTPEACHTTSTTITQYPIRLHATAAAASLPSPKKPPSLLLLFLHIASVIIWICIKKV